MNIKESYLSHEKELGNNAISIFGKLIDPGELERFFSEFKKLMAYYKCALMEIETKLNVLNEEFSLRHDRNPISAIKTRLKTPRSIVKKLAKKGQRVTLEAMEREIRDIAGIRVICAFVEDVYTIARALVEQDDISLVEQKDYIKNPKPNGYRSYHLILTVPIFLSNEKKYMNVEVQLRTIAMDSWADLEHQLKYKKDNVFTDRMAQELYDCSALSCELDKRMDALRESLKL